MFPFKLKRAKVVCEQKKVNKQPLTNYQTFFFLLPISDNNLVRSEYSKMYEFFMKITYPYQISQNSTQETCVLIN